MGLGTALLQPQVTARAAPDGIAAIFEDAQRLAAILAEDAASGGPLAGEIEVAFEAALPRLQSQVEPRLDAARTRLRPWMDALRGFVDGLADGVSEAEGDHPAAIPRMAAQVLRQLRDLLSALTLPGIRQQLERARALIEDDLGLGPTALLGHVTDFLDDLAARFVNAHEGEPADVRRRRRLAANVTAAMRLRLDDITLPSADVEPWARAIFRALGNSGIADAMAQLDCAAEALEKAVAAAAAAAEAARPTAQPIGAGVVPLADAPEYSWYASWLLRQWEIPLLGLSDIKDPGNLHSRLKAPTGDIDRHIRDQWFSVEERAAVDAHATSDDDPPIELMRLMVGVLNREMQRRVVLSDLPPDSALRDDLLTDDIRDLRESYSSNRALLEYNRRVIELAWPRLIEEWSTVHWRRFRSHVLIPLFGDVGVVRHQVTVTGDRRFVLCDDKPIHMGEECRWHEAPIFTEVRHGLWFGFDRVSARNCEITAQVLLTLASLAKPIWHAAEVQPGHEAQAGVFSGLEFAEVLQQFLFGKPLSAHFQLRGSAAHGAGIWLDSAGGWRGISLILTSLQGVVGRDDNDLAAYWLTTFLGDAIRTEKAIRYSNILPDVVLTFITLINSGRTPFDGPHRIGSASSSNHLVQEGITKNIDQLFELWLHAIYDRDNYSVFVWNEPGIGDMRRTAMAGHWFGASCGIAVLSGLAGSVFVQTTAWVEDWARFGLTVKDSFLRFFFQYWIKNYLLNENNTDDGRYRPGGGAYRGYPDKDVARSPYRLPMPGGTALYMGQGNQGLFSHNFIANRDFVNPPGANLQTYAYDFSHQFQEPISCVRSGTVWNPVPPGSPPGTPFPAFNENNPDSNTQNANTLTIMHGPPDAEHDVLEAGSAPVQTWTVYVHLARNGITNAPFWVVNPLAHGTPVAQGDLIALAGDTGMSFHNHLHLHVLADDGTGNPGNRTVPFVFDDVDSNDGVMRSITWYRSRNT